MSNVRLFECVCRGSETQPNFFALMLLAYTMTLMPRSDHLPLSAMRFTAQFDFAVSDRYSYVLRALRKKTYCIVGYGEMVSFQHCYQIKYSPKGSSSMY